jgi:hypothetical protein
MENKTEQQIPQDLLDTVGKYLPTFEEIERFVKDGTPPKSCASSCDDCAASILLALNGDAVSLITEISKEDKTIGVYMASNFHIFRYTTTESLHLKLIGDFNGGSASELINVLANNKDKYFQIFIDTSELSAIHSFGKEVISTHMPEFNHSDTIIQFVGKNIGQPLN